MTAAASGRPARRLPGGPTLAQAGGRQQYHELIEPWLRPPPGLSGRRYAALALARICGARTWADAGQALGWIVGRATMVAEYVCEFVVDPVGFWQAITTLAGLAARARSHRLRPTPEDTVHIGHSGPAHVGSGIRRPRRQVDAIGVQGVAVWLWTTLTCSERRDAPALVDPGWSSVTMKGRLRTCRTMSAWLPEALAQKLLTFGRTLLDSHGVR